MSVTAEIHAPDEIYYWIEEYLMKHSSVSNISLNLDRHSQSESTSNPNIHKADDGSKMYFFKYLWDTIWPTGKTVPRTLIISSKRTKGNKDSHKKRTLTRGRASTGDKDTENDRKIRINMTPSLDVIQQVQFGNRTIQVKVKNNEVGSRIDGEKRTLVISSLFGTTNTLMSFIRAAKDEYYANSSSYVSIYNAQMTTYSSEWTRGAVQTIRPWDSVFLPEGMKEWLLKDCQDFLDEYEFYLKRGVPHRRGYLLYGEPGSGKSSIISALAAKLKLDIYVISLGAKGLDDEKLNTLLQNCPDKCLLLMEDITTDAENLETDQPKINGTSSNKRRKSTADETSWQSSSITLSGLLNAIDGVGSSEGRLLFCTTNWKDHIDKALSRSGRCDVWMEFKRANKQQAQELFVYFYSALHDTNLNGKVQDADSKIDNDFNCTGKHTQDVQLLAEKFASKIPHHQVSVSALQGYLMRYKRNPFGAVENVEEWVAGGCSQSPAITIFGNGSDF
uniref:AAA+ ATPase domain-containing protein n=1 Tax=Kwoniella pini CBS 10737 TaxID=1296096 RepID=A0A1B9I4Z1_9TREE|nr:uncharacterized protein I206_03894 [Kwoniella pini CBS 10737]OCF50569.1 hypothetical protein I206_03894 [Kwoniella pini CBS 10737]